MLTGRVWVEHTQKRRLTEKNLQKNLDTHKLKALIDLVGFEPTTNGLWPTERVSNLILIEIPIDTGTHNPHTMGTIRA